MSCQHHYSSHQLTNISAELAYTTTTTFTTNSSGFHMPSSNVNWAIKCQQISGGDGYSTMANGTQTFMFSFGPLIGQFHIDGLVVE